MGATNPIPGNGFGGQHIHVLPLKEGVPLPTWVSVNCSMFAELCQFTSQWEETAVKVKSVAGYFSEERGQKCVGVSQQSCVIAYDCRTYDTVKTRFGKIDTAKILHSRGL